MTPIPPRVLEAFRFQIEDLKLQAKVSPLREIYGISEKMDALKDLGWSLNRSYSGMKPLLLEIRRANDQVWEKIHKKQEESGMDIGTSIVIAGSHGGGKSKLSADRIREYLQDHKNPTMVLFKREDGEGDR